MLAISVLAPLGAEVNDRRAIVLGGIAGGVGLGVLATAIKLALAYYMPDAGLWEVPLLFLARLQPAVVGFFFTIILWAEIYTTAISSAYGFARRLTEASGYSYTAVVVGSCVAAVFFSRLGFARLVDTLYPFFGYVTIGLLAVFGFRALTARTPE